MYTLFFSDIMLLHIEETTYNANITLYALRNQNTPVTCFIVIFSLYWRSETEPSISPNYIYIAKTAASFIIANIWKHLAVHQQMNG